MYKFIFYLLYYIIWLKYFDNRNNRLKERNSLLERIFPLISIFLGGSTIFIEGWYVERPSIDVDQE